MKITKRQLRKIIRESVLEEARRRRSSFKRYGYTPRLDDGDPYMDAKNALHECFELLDAHYATKRSTSRDVQDQVWQLIRDHYGI